MNDEDKKAFIEDFKKSNGPKRLDLWDFALQQQVIWENIITDIQKIAKEQGVDKELEKMMDEALAEIEKQ